MARNLLNLEEVSKAFDIRALLDGVSLGISEADRIGIVGRNGSGKSTLMKIMSGAESPDAGRVTKSNDTNIGLLSQVDNAPADATVREVVLGNKPTHEWASDSGIREVFIGLFGGFDDHLFERKFGTLSGGERRRVGLARLLIDDLDLILLDEPTNHLDVEGVAWLANHLLSRKSLALAVITHDRWFLDRICTHILAFEGDSKRNNLIRKELAWLRRGAPARTTKPKFRVDAANELISAEPAPRDQGELLKFARNRLGNTVYESHHVQLRAGEKLLLDDLYWNIGPGDRIGIVGINGAGKTTLMRMLTGELQPTAGKFVTGVTVKAAFLTQHLHELDPTWRVLEAVEKIANHVELGNGKSLSASQLCERLGFDRDLQWTPIRDLSGGEKRRLQLTRLLMDSPNVLLLDEPTNDFDIETLTELEDLLDSYGGTLIVVSHDRYFLERVCDRFVGLLGDGALRDLPRGVDQYLEQRRDALSNNKSGSTNKSTSSAAEQRQLKKDVARLEKQLVKLDEQISALVEEQSTAAFDAPRLIEITSKLEELRGDKNTKEEEWLHATTALDI